MLSGALAFTEAHARIGRQRQQIAIEKFAQVFNQLAHRDHSDGVSAFVDQGDVAKAFNQHAVEREHKLHRGMREMISKVWPEVVLREGEGRAAP